MCVLAVFSAGAQVPAGYDFTGSYSDFKQLPPQMHQKQEFTFARLMYNGRYHAYMKNWYTDWPYGDANLVQMLKRTIGIDVAPQSRVVPITSPDLFRYPFIYSGEAGQMLLSDDDARILREYLDRGGFWMIDDFWGTTEWIDFEEQMRKIFPERNIVDIPFDSPVLHSVYDISELKQIPNTGYADSCPDDNPQCPTSEDDGIVPHLRGIFNTNGTIAVLINWNTDLMDGSEGADLPRYPERFSAYSFRIFSNAVVYAMSH